jgi:carboxymethylenebutenolidase
MIDAYVATPASESGAAILLLSDMFGLNAPIRAIADGWAARGHAAMVPNLFWRCDPPGALEYEGPERQVAWERLRQLDVDRLLADLSLAVQTFRQQRKVVAIGFCGGGPLAFLAAARAGVDAAASFYGLGVSKYLAELPKIRCPLQLHYGTKDEHVPMAEIDAVSTAVHGRKNVTVYLYDAGHSFFNPVRPTYDAQATKLAQQRLDTLVASL